LSKLGETSSDQRVPSTVQKENEFFVLDHSSVSRDRDALLPMGRFYRSCLRVFEKTREHLRRSNSNATMLRRDKSRVFSLAFSVSSPVLVFALPQVFFDPERLKDSPNDEDQTDDEA